MDNFKRGLELSIVLTIIVGLILLCLLGLNGIF